MQTGYCRTLPLIRDNECEDENNSTHVSMGVPTGSVRYMATAVYGVTYETHAYYADLYDTYV